MLAGPAEHEHLVVADPAAHGREPVTPVSEPADRAAVRRHRVRLARGAPAERPGAVARRGPGDVGRRGVQPRMQQRGLVGGQPPRPGATAVGRLAQRGEPDIVLRRERDEIAGDVRVAQIRRFGHALVSSSPRVRRSRTKTALPGGKIIGGWPRVVRVQGNERPRPPIVYPGGPAMATDTASRTEPAGWTIVPADRRTGGLRLRAGVRDNGGHRAAQHQARQATPRAVA